MTAVDHAELKRLAEGATPGGWTCKEGSTAYPECDDKDFWAVVLSPAGKEVVTLHERSSFDDRAQYDFDAAFIAAANPAVVLALLSEIEGLKAERDEAAAEAKWNDERANSNLDSRIEAERQLDELRTQAPDSWRPDREAVVSALSELRRVPAPLTDDGDVTSWSSSDDVAASIHAAQTHLERAVAIRNEGGE